jgi:predicted CopG family antitoxin
VFSEVIFELVNPALEILTLLQIYFGNKRVEVKKGIFYEAT